MQPITYRTSAFAGLLLLCAGGCATGDFTEFDDVGTNSGSDAGLTDSAAFDGGADAAIVGFPFDGAPDTSAINDGGSLDTTVDSTVDTGPTPDTGPPPPPPPPVSYVFAHSSSALYQVDTNTLAVTKVGDFGWPSGSDSMTDIALNSTSTVIGVSFDKVYAINLNNANCTFLANLSQQFNGLSFVSRTTPQGLTEEVLIGVALSGDVYEVDPQSGATTQIGSYGGGLTSSGDIVSVQGFGTVATAKKSGYSTDVLVTVDPFNGSANIIGEIGFSDVWGIGFWGSNVYGFTDSGDFILVNTATGQGTLQSSSSKSWWGAGVTTLATVD